MLLLLLFVVVVVVVTAAVAAVAAAVCKPMVSFHWFSPFCCWSKVADYCKQQ